MTLPISVVPGRSWVRVLSADDMPRASSIDGEQIDIVITMHHTLWAEGSDD